MAGYNNNGSQSQGRGQQQVRRAAPSAPAPQASQKSPYTFMERMGHHWKSVAGIAAVATYGVFAAASYPHCAENMPVKSTTKAFLCAASSPIVMAWNAKMSADMPSDYRPAKEGLICLNKNLNTRMNMGIDSRDRTFGLLAIQEATQKIQATSDKGNNFFELFDTSSGTHVPVMHIPDMKRNWSRGNALDLPELKAIPIQQSGNACGSHAIPLKVTIPFN